MSDKLMDTAPGGETPQYESIKTTNVPHSKDGGQLGDESTDAPKTTETSEGKAARGEKTAENIRYGQAISEGGMGGKTTEDSHETQSQDYGRSSQSKETPGVSTEQNRASEGYGGKEDMDKNVGA